MTTPYYELQELWSLLLEAPPDLREEWWTSCKNEYPSMWQDPMVRKCVAKKYNTWKREEAVIKGAGLEPLGIYGNATKPVQARFLANPLWLLVGVLAVAFVFSNTKQERK